MRALVQRAASGSVTVDGLPTGAIGKGLVVLVGVTHGDTVADAEYLAERCAGLRIFCDANGKMNLSVLDVAGSILAVSQFTLYADTSSRRPGFSAAAAPDLAEECYEAFIAHLRKLGLPVATGVFGAHMSLSIVNDGPVTIMLESKKVQKNNQ
jgi:D-tyrosyl-tRNA(Tyr) deacylase